MQCLLCKTERVSKICEIKKDDLIKLYDKNLKIDCSNLIVRDIEFYQCELCKLKFFYPTITGDQKFYEELAKHDWYYLEEKEEFLFAKKFINPDYKVLEVGCGNGAFASLIKNNYYIGIELNDSAIKECLNKGIRVEKISIEEYSKSHQESFDVVVSFQVLEHVQRPREFIESMINCLKPNGVLIISVPNEDSFLKYTKNTVLNMPPHHITRWSYFTMEFLPKLFDINLIQIYQEPLQEYHKIWYLTTLFTNAILRNDPNILIDLSLKYRILNKIGSIIAKILCRGLREELLPKGHTMVAVYKKYKHI